MLAFLRDRLQPASSVAIASEHVTSEPAPAIPKPTRKKRQKRKAERIVVVGNGMAAWRFVRTLREVAPIRDFPITIIGDEPQLAYNRVNLTTLLSGEPASSLDLSPAGWYEKHRVELRTGEKVLSIDRERRRIDLPLEQVLEYDRLVLATGSRPFVPPVRGLEQPGVLLYRTVHDIERIREQSASAKRVTVLGGGLLGLEIGAALRTSERQVTVLERAGHLLPVQLDPTTGGMLATRMEQSGLEILLGVRVTEVAGRLPDLRVGVEGREHIPTDMVVVAAGVRPRDELAQPAGLETGPRGGFMVDDALTTNDPLISAIGECASHRGTCYGVIAPGYAMADVLARRLAGDEDALFTSGDTSTRLKVGGMPVAAFGDNKAETTDNARVIVWEQELARRVLHLRADGALLGATVLGAWDQLELVQQAVEQERVLTDEALDAFAETGQLFAGDDAPSVADWPESKIVCRCMLVNRGQLGEAMKLGARTVEDFGKATGAGMVCGACRPLLGELVGLRIEPTKVAGRRLLLISSVLAGLLIPTAVLLGPVPRPESIQNALFELDQLWRLGWVRQTTGFILAATAFAGLILSMRKRIPALRRLGSFGWYRVAHSVIGLLCILGVAVHTGMHLGENLNMALMLVFLSLNALGALAGITTAFESRGVGRLAEIAREWKPWLTRAHIILFWPFPVLLGFHIASVYVY